MGSEMCIRDRILAEAADKEHVVYTADVKTAFLNAEIGEDIVCCQPPDEWTPTLPVTGEPVVWRLRKALYGLRSAPKRWQ